MLSLYHKKVQESNTEININLLTNVVAASDVIYSV